MGIPTAALISAVFALWWDCGNIHSFHNADDLVPVMASLWHWTPFYWGEDRFGMPLGLLASLFHNPLTNLLVQNWMSAFLGFLGLALLPACVAGKPGISAGILTAGIFIALAPDQALYGWFGTGQCYGTAMGFGAAALALVNSTDNPGKARITASALLVFLSIWTNTAMILILAPLALWLARRKGMGRTAAIFLALTAIASFCLVRTAMRPAEYTRTYSIIPPGGWVAAWGTMAGAIWAGLLRWKMAAVLGAALAAGTAAAIILRQARNNIPGAVALIASGGVYFGVTAIIGWVASRSGDSRYTLPVLALLSASAGLMVPAITGLNRARLAALLLFPFIATGIRAGLPYPPGVRPALDRSIGTATPEIIQRGVTHVAGDYTRVWPAVFHANMALYGTVPDRTVWALTARNAQTRALWDRSDRRAWRIAVLRGDTGLTPWSPQLKGARETARTRTITVFRAAVK